MNDKLRECPKCGSGLFVGGAEDGELYSMCINAKCFYQKRIYVGIEKDNRITELEREVERLKGLFKYTNRKRRYFKKSYFYQIYQNIPTIRKQREKLEKECSEFEIWNKNLEDLNSDKQKRITELKAEVEFWKNSASINAEKRTDRGIEIAELKAKNEDMEKRVDDFEDTIHKIDNWCKAYPISVFPEPTKEDWKKATEILREKGYHLVNFSLGFTRYVLEGIEKILTDKEG